MSKFRRPAGLPFAIPLLLFALALIGCRTVPVAEYEALEAELDATTADLVAANRTIAERDAELGALAAQVADLRETLSRQRIDASAIGNDLELALRQLGTLRENRLDLRDELDELERELRGLRRASDSDAAARETAATPPEGEPSSPGRATSTGAAARGFSRVPTIGLQNDPVAASRLAGAAPGIGVDTADVPILYDSRLDYSRTMIYLTVVDPEGRRPRLRLTAQYVTDADPLRIETAFITVEGGDPIDPIDPIVLSGTPIRETDGELLREALATTTDSGIVDRLSTMIASNRLQITFVGESAQHTHRPTVAERAAMSNILFAFIDLGGLR